MGIEVLGDIIGDMKDNIFFDHNSDDNEEETSCVNMKTHET